MHIIKVENQEQLEKSLQKEASALMYQRKNVLKNRLLTQIATTETDTLPVKMRNLANSFVLGRARKFVLKELIFESLALRTGIVARFVDEFKFFFDVLFGRRSKVLASGLVFAILFVLIQPFFGTKDLTYAVSFVDLANVNGDVSVIRDGSTIKAYDDFQLRPGDRILTGLKSDVELDFYNGNLLRLNENTDLTVKNLDFNDLLLGGADFFLNRGDVWFDVVATESDTSNFVIYTPQIKASLAEAGAGHLRRYEDASRILAVTTTLDVVISRDRQLILSKLAPEQMLKVYRENGEVNQDVQVGFFEKLSDADLLLYERNLLADKQRHILLNARFRTLIEERAGLTPDDALYPLKELRRSAELALAFGDKEKVKLKIAKEKFYEASKLLNEGNKDVAEKLFIESKQQIADVSLKLSEITLTDPEKGAELKQSLVANLAEQKQSLLALDSASEQEELVTVSEAISDSELLATKLGEAVDQTAEVIDLVETADINGAVAVLKTVGEAQLMSKDNLTDAAVTLSDGSIKQTSLTGEKAVIVPSLGILVQEIDSLKEIKEKTGSITLEPAVVEPVQSEDSASLELADPADNGVSSSDNLSDDATTSKTSEVSNEAKIQSSTQTQTTETINISLPALKL